MNKQNQFVGGFNLWSKANYKKLIQPDNSILHVTMPENIKKQIISSQTNLEKIFEQCFHQTLSLQPYLKTNPEYSLVSTKEELKQVQQLLEKQKIVFIKIFEQNHRSFKGFCTWISITTSAATYLIDLMVLRKEIESQGLVLFLNPNVIKIGLNIRQQIEGLQRDFNIFTRTVLDLNQMLGLCGLLSDLRMLVREYFPKLVLPNKSYGSYYKRPSSDIQLQFICVCSQVLPHILCLLRERLAENKTLLEAFLMSNKLCLNVYECKLSKFSQQFQQTIKKMSPKQERICLKLLKWRIHTGRIRDQSPEYILPDYVIHQIIIKNIKSMGELLALYEQAEGKEICRDYDQALLEIINSQSPKINITKCQNEVNQCKNINDFVRMMGWTDCNWKNSSSSSIKLFKQIISMDPIESSIIENELNETKGRVLSNDTIMDLFGYVQYFSKGDAKGLELQYKKFMENYESQMKQSGSEKSFNASEGNMGGRSEESNSDSGVQSGFRIPESIEQIYQLANTKKKSMNKEKKKSLIAEEKEEPFVLNAQEFLKSIGWN